MTNQASTEVAENQTPATNDLSNPNLSFADYERLRRGETVTDVKAKSAPVEKTIEQKEPSESETEETEAKSKTESKDESESEEESETDLEDKPRKKGGFQRRIDKLNARYSAAQAEIEHWKQQALNSASEPKQDKKVDSKVETVEGKPSADDFETHAEYVEALTDWKIEQRELAKRQNDEKSKMQSEHEKLNQSYIERVKSFSEKNKDFQDAVEAIDDVIFSAAAIQLIKESDVGPELVYELAKNRSEAERIAKLSPLAVARELGKLEAKLTSKSSEEPKTESKKITNAPKPIETVGRGGATVAKSIDDPNISFSDYERMRREQLKRRA